MRSLALAIAAGRDMDMVPTLGERAFDGHLKGRVIPIL